MNTLSLPTDFISRTQPLFGPTLWQQFLDGMSAEPPVSIRLNPLKTSASVADIPSAAASVPWCPAGIYLSERPNFTLDPMLHAGAYYVQEAGSMFIDHVLRNVLTADGRPLTSAAINALDLCAAPGGKTTALRAALSPESVVVANEPIGKRSQILAENVWKQGHPNIFVTNNYPADFRKLRSTFSLIVADVPCSGEGMFRKDPGAISEWSTANVEKCAALQRDIVSDIWPLLDEGGIMIYSTCTFNTLENEENVRWICDTLGAQPLTVPTLPQWNITGSLLAGFTAPVYRFIPGVTASEGLFVSILRKGGSPKNRNLEPSKNRIIDNSKNRKSESSKIPPITEKDLSPLRLHKAEPTVKGKDTIPHQREALLVPTLRAIAQGSCPWPAAPVSYDQAIAYLRKEAITLPAATPRGIVLVTYNGLPLGFAKNIGNRANNLYPAEWKIKTTHITPTQVIA